MRTSNTRGGNGARLQNPTQYSSFSPAGVQYQTVYPQQQQQQQQQQQGAPFGSGLSGASSTRGGAKVKSAFVPSLQQQQQQQLLAQQQQAAGAGGATALNMPSYADQMQAAFLDYQRQRVEFEQQQQQLLQKLYHYYPDVSGALASQTGSQSAATAASGAAPTSGSRYVQRQSANLNGLQQPQQQQQQQRQQQSVPSFYSTQQHLGFMQQQQQDVLRDQQQSVAQQFATSQLAPTTTQSFGMAVPMSSVLGTPSYQSSPEVSHVNFSSGNLNYSF
ncbi:transcription activator GAGA isoform X1 [Drosophila tropicalis]|uniref:transcription activator GAGA isoform X1 n=1 Tax=Drosophila tropicalis TaxID=46794 RepID=UPI0035ABD930